MRETHYSNKLKELQKWFETAPCPTSDKELLACILKLGELQALKDLKKHKKVLEINTQIPSKDAMLAYIRLLKLGGYNKVARLHQQLVWYVTE